MQRRILPAMFLSMLISGSAYAQDPATAQPSQQNDQSGMRQRGGGGRGFGGGMGMGIAGGRGLMGTVTAVAPDHFVVKSEDGQTYTVQFSVNTRMMKQPAGSRGMGAFNGGMVRGDGQQRGQGSGQGTGQNGGRGFGGGGVPPEPIKATDIKVGDAIGAMGQMDQSTKSLGAVAIVLLDPETARRMEEMRANYGKTWLQGRVTSIDGVKVNLSSALDNTAQSFVADENTTFRKFRDPITLSDISPGDMLRAEGAIKDGIFTATTVDVMGRPPGGARQGGGDNGPPPPLPPQ
jgi:uncharacterized protein DUF5666